MAKNNRFHTQWPEVPEMGTFEAFTLPSMTEPDNSMSIPEIIARYTRGQGIPVQQYQWTAGQAAPEDGESVPQDATAEAVLELAAADPVFNPTGTDAAPTAAEPAAEPPVGEPAPAGA